MEDMEGAFIEWALWQKEVKEEEKDDVGGWGGSDELGGMRRD